MLKNKTALITGTNRGIGKAILELFAANGARIYAHAREGTREFLSLIERVSEKHGVSVLPLCFDITDDVAMKAELQKCHLAENCVDILVNNAGVMTDGSPCAMTSIEKLKATFEVNFNAQIRLTQYVARLMMRNESGSIVNISSVAALNGDGPFDYIASKAALLGATRALARELGPFNIRVNAIAPGITDTDMGNQIKEERKAGVLSKTILKRAARPEEIAGAVLFLASDYSSYVDGQVLRVDGGM